MSDRPTPPDPADLGRVLSGDERDEMGRRFLREIMNDAMTRAWDAALPPWLRTPRRGDPGS